MPPINCTSKWRWPMVRLAASRTVAKAGARMSSSEVAVGDLLLEIVGARPELLVGERCQFRLKRVDLVDPRLIAANPPLIGGAEQLAGNGADHTEGSSIPGGGSNTPPRPDIASGVPEIRHFSGKFDANALANRR